MSFFERKHQEASVRFGPGVAGEALGERNERYFTLFAWYLRLRFALRFHATLLSGLVPNVLGPLIIYSNHPGWWDPAFYILLNHKLFPGHTGYGPMDEAALARYPILRRMGIFGINPNTRAGAARFLTISRAVLARPDGVLWITAEGAFTDPRARPVALRRGIAHLARACPDVTILPLALEYSFWNDSHPEALARFGVPLRGDRELSLAGWQDRLQAALALTMDALAADSMSRDPARFRRLQGGRGGADAIYDTWRGLRSRLNPGRAQGK